MGNVVYDDKEKVWTFSYQNDVYCPFYRDKKVITGSFECIHCSSFILVDRDRNSHTTEVKCKGNPVRGAFRRVVERN